MAIRSAKGTLQKLGSAASPPVFATVGQVRSITGPSTRATVQDVTTHSTTGNWMEKLATLIDPGTIGFAINYDKAESTHAFLTGMWANLIALTQSDWETVLPASIGTLYYQGYLTSHAFTLPVDNVISCAIEVAINGSILALNV